MSAKEREMQELIQKLAATQEEVLHRAAAVQATVEKAEKKSRKRDLNQRRVKKNQKKQARQIKKAANAIFDAKLERNLQDFKEGK